MLSAISILSESGIAVSADIVPEQRQAAAYEGVRSEKTESAAALRITGAAVPERPGGGIVGYTSDAGTVVFRTGGVFAAQLFGVKAPENAKAAWMTLSSILKEAGFDLSGTTHEEKPEGGRLSVECVQRIESLEVFNGRIKAEYSENGTLLINGRWATLSDLSPTSDNIKDRAELLLSLRECLFQEGISAGQVARITDGYLITAPSAEKIGLSPVWQVVVSGEVFYLDKTRGVFVLAG